jgi:hypothetical protein
MALALHLQLSPKMILKGCSISLEVALPSMIVITTLVALSLISLDEL